MESKFWVEPGEALANLSDQYIPKYLDASASPLRPYKYILAWVRGRLVKREFAEFINNIHKVKYLPTKEDEKWKSG